MWKGGSVFSGKHTLLATVSANFYSFLSRPFWPVGVQCPQRGRASLCDFRLPQRGRCCYYPETPGLVGNGGNSRSFPRVLIFILTRWLWTQNFLFPSVDHFPSPLNMRFLKAVTTLRMTGAIQINSRTPSGPVAIPSLIWPQLKGPHSAFPTWDSKQGNTQHKSLR